MNQADKRARRLSLRVYHKPKKSAGCAIAPRRTDIEIIEAERGFYIKKGGRYGR
jgi:hypothetical protein